MAEDIEFVLDESVPSAVFEITVEDPNLGYELPETGGTGTAVFTAAGLLLTAGSLIYGYKRRSERRRREG